MVYNDCQNSIELRPSQVVDDPGELLLRRHPHQRVRVLEAARVHPEEVLVAARPQVQQQRRGHGRLRITGRLLIESMALTIPIKMVLMINEHFQKSVIYLSEICQKTVYYKNMSYNSPNCVRYLSLICQIQISVRILLADRFLIDI